MADQQCTNSIQKQFSSYSDLTSEHEKFGITNGRNIARFLSRYSWYNPVDNSSSYSQSSSETKTLLEKDSDEKKRMSLDSGWAYFEHITLPRRLVKDDGTEVLSATENIKVESGTSQKTKLYDPLDTYIYELSDFGIGVGLYL